MKILHRPKTQRHVVGDQRAYYLPTNVEFEFIFTDFPPRHEQHLHAHKIFHEMVYVERGVLEAVEWRGQRAVKKVLKAGDMVIFDNPFCHTLNNKSKRTARTITCKFLAGTKRSEKRFRADKYVCSHSAHLGEKPLRPGRYLLY